MSSVKYKTNPLEKVIFRIDFEPIELARLSRFYAAELKDVYPLKETKKGIEVATKFDFKTGETLQEKQEFTEWHFINSDTTKRLIVTSKSFILEYSKYNDSEELLSDIGTGIVKLMAEFNVQTVIRVGLRYINKLKPEDQNPMDWKKYLNKNLLGNLEFSKGKFKLARSMGQIVIKNENDDIVFNYGQWNDDFPNEITKKEFILDFDCYSKFPSPATELDVETTTKEFNQKIEDLFESCITTEFKNLLNK